MTANRLKYWGLVGPDGKLCRRMLSREPKLFQTRREAQVKKESLSFWTRIVRITMTWELASPKSRRGVRK